MAIPSDSHMTFQFVKYPDIDRVNIVCRSTTSALFSTGVILYYSVPEFPVRGDVPAKHKPRAQRRESFLYRLPSEELLSKIRLPDTRKG